MPILHLGEHSSNLERAIVKSTPLHLATSLCTAAAALLIANSASASLVFNVWGGNFSGTVGDVIPSSNAFKITITETVAGQVRVEFDPGALPTDFFKIKDVWLNSKIPVANLGIGHVANTVAAESIESSDTGFQVDGAGKFNLHWEYPTDENSSWDPIDGVSSYTINAPGIVLDTFLKQTVPNPGPENAFKTFYAAIKINIAGGPNSAHYGDYVIVIEDPLVTETPEPASLALLGLTCVCGLGVRFNRRRRSTMESVDTIV